VLDAPFLPCDIYDVKKEVELGSSVESNGEDVIHEAYKEPYSECPKQKKAHPNLIIKFKSLENERDNLKSELSNEKLSLKYKFGFGEQEFHNAHESRKVLEAKIVKHEQDQIESKDLSNRLFPRIEKNLINCCIYGMM
ncbi:unnamed protein product, partial [Ilex paraguariensis]